MRARPVAGATKLLFLPGAGGNPAFWQPVSDRLTHPGARRLMGWPGFGSVPASPNAKGFKDLVALAVDEIDQPTAIIAQSMGGVIAVQAALRKPTLVTHLVLTVTSGGVDMSDLQVMDWRPAYFEANPNAPRWFADYAGDVSALLADIRVPVLLIWGDADPISPVSIGHRLQRLFPVSHLHIVPGGEHDLACKHASRIAPLIDAHLRNTD